MKSTLLLIDVQLDFLHRKGLNPKPDRLIEQFKKLVDGCRKRQIPVVHIHTQVRPDGSDRMPHWIQNDSWFCVEGSPGILPPNGLQPMENEQRLTKQYFSGFSNPLLDATLHQHETETVIVAGLYLHGCIRSTVLDAYERNYQVIVIEDAVGSTEPEHAMMTRAYLDGRASTFIDRKSLLSQYDNAHKLSTRKTIEDTLPVAHINGEWVNTKQHPCHIHHNPSNWIEEIASIPIATVVEVKHAAEAAATVQKKWRSRPKECRTALLNEWARVMQQNKDKFAKLLALEIGKPLSAGYDEIERAISLILITADQLRNNPGQQLGTKIYVHSHPRGVIGIITPWNNPVAIPAGKIAPAIAMGNSVVWKPALEAPRTAMLIIETLIQAGTPNGLLNLVNGNAITARHIIEHPSVSAVTITGSIETGRVVSTLCSQFNKPLQAELGGNNAAIVWHDCDLQEQALQIALSAFSFAGQRCTAIQRFIVERSILAEFETALIEATASLTIGAPDNNSTQLGPLISQTHRRLIQQSVAQAIKDGASLKFGNNVPEGLMQGCWLIPSIISQVTPDMLIAKKEVFGPVAVIIGVDHFEAAINLANNVEYGLVAALYSSDVERRRQFSEKIEAGILTFSAGPLAIHPQAPFGGWKASMIGPPEHGVWDQQFYSRVQSIYDAD